MRWLAAMLAIGAIGALGAAANPSAVARERAPRAGRCKPAGSQPRVVGRAVRVYRLRRVLYACARATGYVRRLGVQAPDTECDPDLCNVHEVHVAGRFVAFASESGGRSGTHGRVVVVDMDARREVTDTPTVRAMDAALGLCPGHPGLDGEGGTTDIALRADGAIAWIAFRDCAPDPSPFEVHARGPGGDRLLDAGFAIAPTSLGLGRTSVVWQNAGDVRVAPL
jgi:hypothetical protein